MVKVELTKPIERRIRKIFFRGIFWEYLLYLAVALSGYFSFMDETDPMVINRPALAGSHDYLMFGGRIAVLVLTVVSIPLILSPCRE